MSWRGFVISNPLLKIFPYHVRKILLNFQREHLKSPKPDSAHDIIMMLLEDSKF